MKTLVYQYDVLFRFVPHLFYNAERYSYTIGNFGENVPHVPHVPHLSEFGIGKSFLQAYAEQKPQPLTPHSRACEKGNRKVVIKYGCSVSVPHLLLSRRCSASLYFESNAEHMEQNIYITILEVSI